MSYCSIFDSTLFGNCLADLRLSELLILKHSLQPLKAAEAHDENHYSHEVNVKCSEESKESCYKPTTMALVATQRGYDVSQTSLEYGHREEKPSKLQTLFQISVTALAFLSFGGYLLCLIVQSIKSKGSAYFHPVNSTTATVNGIKRIKVYRRNRRSSLPPFESTEPYNFYGEKHSPYQYYQQKRIKRK